MNSRLRYLFAPLLIVFSLLAAHAQEAKPAHEPHPKATAGKEAAQLPSDTVTQHTINLSGHPINYKATAGTIEVNGPKGEPAAKMFYVAYTAEGGGARPVTFAFNGGPGAGAAFLNIGAIGPRIVPFKENGSAPVLPVELVDNADSWLAFTDLVFIDPVGTGYSRAISGGTEAEKAFWNVDKDISSIADFIRLYLSENGRELAPLYLAGESYGGFRAAALSDKLLSMGMQLKGAVMISPALEFSMLRGDDYFILPLTFELPSLTAANTEIRGGPSASLETVHEAEHFALNNYLLHLAEGLSTDASLDTALAKFTGLEASTIEKHHGRVSASLFAHEYLKRTDRALSVYDATVSIPVPRPTEHSHIDPILDSAVSVLGPAMESYARKELGFRTNLEYRLLDRQISGQWNFGIKSQGFAGSLDDLEQARVRDPALKIFIAHGYTDLVTPYTMSRYLISQLKPIDGATPVGLHVYRGGHMMYLRPASRAQLSKDVSSLYEAPAAK